MTEQELEDFIRKNKDKFDIYHPTKSHKKIFLDKLHKRLKHFISIIPHLIKVGIATVIIFVLSILVWNNFIRPPLSKSSFKKYWKIEHVYKYKNYTMQRTLLHDYLKNPIEKEVFIKQMKSMDSVYYHLRGELKKDLHNKIIIDSVMQYYQLKYNILKDRLNEYQDKLPILSL